ncbi:glyceraldehyde-3-phosphate dehydrogenase [Salibacterium qingdaonense]|uniref:Glyceraldehyde-3-phosphate dehydrogenase n=1 Tax=Salibacterium qingdaonense TaxID=266892 RepID=A0A1I4NPB5_9BACI|nr:glyceraldehyde-3-phosphate dehydrogenase [Salibacterium qingdaonense]SFM17309.1 glyceraldehyde-3-phosphate dehydrogenase (NAD+) [Salibacterium qingdaonense]
MKPRVAVNGFGRIGRMVFRKAVTENELDIAAVNAGYPAETLAHLLKYDSTHGLFEAEVRVDSDALIVNGKRIQIVNERCPENLPWEELNIDIVVEATGAFKERKAAARHLEAGAEKVIITAPGKQEDAMIVMGVNEEDYDPEEHHVISNASCTTNCMAPVVKILEHSFGIESGLMTTVHSYTNDQMNIDNPHKDLRRARSCGQSIIPTSTGAASAIGALLPQLQGKLNGMALRVPTPNVSLVDMVIDLKQTVTEEEMNKRLEEAASSELEGILGFSRDPLVSIDYNKDPRSAVIDGMSTMVQNDRQVKIIAWYDNEWGYSCRVVDLARYVGRFLKKESTVSV